jgi:multidrug transporter EmrE-like cation transporter
MFFISHFCRVIKNKKMNWINLLLAGLFEIGWTIGLKQMDNHKIFYGLPYFTLAL